MTDKTVYPRPDLQRNSIRFKIPSLPSSINQIYAINFGQRHIFIRPEVKRWKTEMKLYVPLWHPNDSGFIYMEIDYYGQWFHKNGAVRRIDLPNLEKVTVDTVCEKMGIDDKFIFHKESKKIESGNEYIDIFMRLIGYERTIGGTQHLLPEQHIFGGKQA